MYETETKPGLFGWWKKVLFENYANFNGRARRAEYWNYALANLILLIPFYILGFVGAVSDCGILTGLGFFVYGVGILGTIVPSIAVGVRRLHDLNKSGWYYFIALIPFVGSVILLVWFFTGGTRAANEYGEDPKNPTGPVFEFEQAQA